MISDEQIRQAIRHQIASNKGSTTTPDEIDKLVTNVKQSIENKTYIFSNIQSFVIKKDGKTRLVKQFSDPLSIECILCQCIKQSLDNSFAVKYPNRNKLIKRLFGTLSAVKQMSDYTIVKFDFKDYYNSVSTDYVFKKILEKNLKSRCEIDLLNELIKSIEFTYAGISTSNIIAEIIAVEFDKEVRKAIHSTGVLYFERYIDDGIIVFNDYISEHDIQIILEESLKKTFHDNSINCNKKCKTKLNKDKFKYISKRDIVSTTNKKNNNSIDYLGYEFFFSNDPNKKLMYGITKEKMDKYNSRLDKIIKYYIDSSDPNKLELLRHRLRAFTSREVYLDKRNNHNVWKVKGFISNYGELRYFINSTLITNETENFLKNMVKDGFERVKCDLPYFMNTEAQEKRYQLHENLSKNRTLLFAENIGYDLKSLQKLCTQIDIPTTCSSGKSLGYEELLRKYLIKITVEY